MLCVAEGPLMVILYVPHRNPSHFQFPFLTSSILFSHSHSYEQFKCPLQNIKQKCTILILIPLQGIKFCIYLVKVDWNQNNKKLRVKNIGVKRWDNQSCQNILGSRRKTLPEYQETCTLKSEKRYLRRTILCIFSCQKRNAAAA